MRRTLLAVVFIVHGLAHSAAGVWAANIGPVWAAVPLWLVAEAGFVAAGLGLLGVPALRAHWQPIAFFAGVSSVALLASFGALPLLGGLAIDVVLLVLATAVAERSSELTELPDVSSRRWRAVTGGVAGWAFLAYLVAVIALRPWHTTWGASAEERAMPLPGDQIVEEAHYRLDHAVTVEAPADSVWPWIVQIGQDRAGFYSYDRLEQLIGDDIHNADRIHPEWQHRRVGERVLLHPMNGIPITRLDAPWSFAMGAGTSCSRRGRTAGPDSWRAPACREGCRASRTRCASSCRTS
jgi:hypothetical protein